LSLIRSSPKIDAFCGDGFEDAKIDAGRETA
jgi:hypothetical protein